MPLQDKQTLDIVFEREGTEPIVALAGRFTFVAHEGFRQMLERSVERLEANCTLTIDLRGVQFVDSAALGMLLLAREAVRARSAQISLRGATGQVQRMLSISKFETLFAVAPG